MREGGGVVGHLPLSSLIRRQETLSPGLKRWFSLTRRGSPSQRPCRGFPFPEMASTVPVS